MVIVLMIIYVFNCFFLYKSILGSTRHAQLHVDDDKQSCNVDAICIDKSKKYCFYSNLLSIL